MSERSQRTEEFGARVARFRGRRLALYGTGVNARDILGRWGDELGIDLLVDDACAGGTAFGRRVVSLAEAISQGVEVIAVAAKVSAVEPVCRRILGPCTSAGVTVCDLYGNDLAELGQRLRTARIPATGLRRAMEGCDVLCVDSFSSLLRPVQGLPDELEHPFPEVLSGPFELVVLADPSERSEDELLKDLREAGLDHLSRVFCQSTTGESRENGLFRRVCEAYPGKRILHVGQDPVRDGLYPMMFGLDARVLEAEAKGTDGTPSPSLREEGETTLASALALATAGYLSWLVPRLREGSFDGVIFPSRDGRVVMRAYEGLREARPDLTLPKAFYLPISRRAIAQAFLDDPAALRWFASSSDAETLPRMTGVALEVETDTYLGRLRALRAAHEQLSQRAAEARSGVRAQMERLGIDAAGRFAFCEFVSVGTCQRLLSRATGAKLQGLYYGVTHGEAVRGIESYLSPRHQAFLGRYATAEALLGSTEPPLDAYLADGSLVHGADDRKPAELAAIEAAHGEIGATCARVLAERDFSLPPLDPDAVDAAFAAAADPACGLTTTDSWRGVPNVDGARLTGNDERKTR